MGVEFSLFNLHLVFHNGVITATSGYEEMFQFVPVVISQPMFKWFHLQLQLYYYLGSEQSRK